MMATFKILAAKYCINLSHPVTCDRRERGSQRVEHQHQITFADQGLAQQSFVQSSIRQSFIHQPPVQRTYNSQSLVVQQPN